MNALPTSIESYLLESGFTPTEILILKRLLEEDALTLRELATKTGKSTGVLDQATKKLLRKEIIAKEWINDAFRYTIHSLDAVSHWMQDDMLRKRDALERRHENFETFLRSIELEKQRPESQHFHGDEGMQRACTALLDQGKEMLQYLPITCAIEDDPMRDFKVQYFRERRRRGMYARVITHNTPLGRRFESRDPFEYRKTLLVSEDEYPFNFEKVIDGDTVACFNMLKKRACLIHYPELAAMERSMFESLWKKEAVPKSQPIEEWASIKPNSDKSSTEVPMKTEFLSWLREFFLTRNSLFTFLILGAIASSLSATLHAYISKINLNLLRERAEAIAINSSHMLDPYTLQQLQKEEDWQKPEWKEVVSILKNIRLQNEGVKYVYLFRRDPRDPTQLRFVADSHSLNPYANTDSTETNDVDTNEDGIIDPQGPDLLQWPNQLYPPPPNFQFEVFDQPVSTDGFYEDGWGVFVTGYAPIKNQNRTTEAVLAIDFSPKDLKNLNQKLVNPVAIFVSILLLFTILRLMASNKPILRRTRFFG